MTTVSVLIPCLQEKGFIRVSLNSVLSFEVPPGARISEIFVIDGGSTDGSVDIIRRHAGQLAYWVSEPDRGQSHAINKGFERATGDIFGWLNSDDWYHPGALRSVAAAFAANPDAGAVVGAGVAAGAQPITSRIVIRIANVRSRG